MGQTQNAIRKHKRTNQVKKELHQDHQGFGEFCQKARHEIPTILDRPKVRRRKARKVKAKEAIRKKEGKVRNEKGQGSTRVREVQIN